MASSYKVEPKHWTLIAALALAAYACYALIAPYVGSIVLAFIVSLLFFPLHEKIEGRLSKHPNIAASLSCVLLTVIVIIPLIFVAAAILQQGIHFFTNAYTWLTHGGAKEIVSMPIVQSSLST